MADTVGNTGTFTCKTTFKKIISCRHNVKKDKNNMVLMSARQQFSDYNGMPNFHIYTGFVVIEKNVTNKIPIIYEFWTNLARFITIAFLFSRLKTFFKAHNLKGVF